MDVVDEKGLPFAIGNAGNGGFAWLVAGASISFGARWSSRLFEIINPQKEPRARFLEQLGLNRKNDVESFESTGRSSCLQAAIATAQSGSNGCLLKEWWQLSNLLSSDLFEKVCGRCWW